MHDLIYMPFHCSELGLNLVEFSVCYKEQFGVKANTLLTALGNQTISANCTCTGVVFSQWAELLIWLNPEIYERFFSLQLWHLRFLRRCLSITEMNCVYKNRALSAHWWGMDHGWHITIFGEMSSVLNVMCFGCSPFAPTDSLSHSNVSSVVDAGELSFVRVF